MSQVEWEKVDAKKIPTLLAEINEHIKPVPFSVETTIIRKIKLPFYSGYVFYELTDLSVVPTVKKYAIYKKGDIHIIDWTNQVIYDVNEKAPLEIKEDNIVDYIKFFFNYVRGRHGRFIVIESIDGIQWKIEPPAQGRKVIQETLKPVELLSKNDDGSFTANAFMLFKDSLFQTKIHVTPDGMVNLSDEELKIEGMPIIQDMIAE